MTTMKERIVALSRNNKLKKFMIVYTIITIIVMIMSLFVELEPIVSIMSIIIIILWTTWAALIAIEKREEKIIKNNKLRYIILSDELVLFCYIMFFISCPIIEISSILVGYNIIIRTILIAISIIVSSNLSILISKHFKNKLSK